VIVETPVRSSWVTDRIGRVAEDFDTGAAVSDKKRVDLASAVRW
jgi:hypothetical protein